MDDKPNCTSFRDPRRLARKRRRDPSIARLHKRRRRPHQPFPSCDRDRRRTLQAACRAGSSPDTRCSATMCIRHRQTPECFGESPGNCAREPCCPLMPGIVPSSPSLIKTMAERRGFLRLLQHLIHREVGCVVELCIAARSVDRFDSLAQQFAIGSQL